MAVLAAAALLDELMGRNRNIAPNEKGKELNWEDADYCKYYLVKFCPHDLFVNTRADLGVCTKVHDDEVKKLFEQSKGHRKIYYQEEFIRFCTSMVNEVDRKIIKGKQRLALSGKGEGSSLTPAQTQKNQEQIVLLNERINGLVEEAEQAGNNGNVEQAQGLMKLCDQLKDERDNLKKLNDNSHWSSTAELAAAQEKQMEVCEVCGAFLIVGDAQQRIDDHLMGKQHVGYARLKAAIEEIQEVVDTQRDERRGARGSSMEDRRERHSSRPYNRDNGRDKNGRDRSEHGNDLYKERKDKERKDRDRDDKYRRETNQRSKERERERERKHRPDRTTERDRNRDRDRSRHSHRR